MCFLQPDNTVHALRHGRASGYFKFSISSYFISLKNWLWHLGCVCSPDAQCWLCLQSRIQVATSQGPQCLTCGHSCIDRSALDVLALEHKPPPFWDALHGDRTSEGDKKLIPQ